MQVRGLAAELGMPAAAARRFKAAVDALRRGDVVPEAVSAGSLSAAW